MSWSSRLKSRRTELLLAAATIAALAPFLHRGFDIDEPLFLWMAEQIAKNPLDPYGFQVNWASIWQPMWVSMQNPPLCSYYIAAVASIAGWSEIALHSGFLLPAVAAIGGTFALARRFCRLPVAAALLTLFTPLFAVSAATVMCDVMLLAFWVWAIELWLRALETQKHSLFVSSALLITAATFTKYFGISLVPTLLIYSLLSQKKGARSRFVCLCLPVVALLIYEAVTYMRYGTPLFSGAMIYLRQASAAANLPASASLLTGCSFLGGCAIGGLFFLRQRQYLLLGGIFVIATLLFRWLLAPGRAFGANTTAVQLEGGLFAAFGAIILTLAFSDWAKNRTPESLLLLLWTLGTFLFATFLNWSITARTLLPLLPAVAILLIRVWEERQPTVPRLPAIAWRLACAAAIALLITYADYRQAGTSREAAHYFRARYAHTAETVWFQSHWGFQFYMQQWKAKPVTKDAEFRSGETIIIPSNNADPMPVSSETIVPAVELRLEAFPYATTFAPGTGAAFYSSARGPVPWIVGRTPSYHFEAVTVR